MMLKEFITDKNYKLLEFNELQNYINELTKLDITIVSQQENKETKNKKMTIKIQDYTITFELKQIIPNFETLIVKVYNKDNVNIEKITFCYDEGYKVPHKSNYYIDYKKIVEKNWMLQIISQSNTYLNNTLINERNSCIKTSKKEIKEYFHNRVANLSKDVESYYYNICKYNTDQVYEVTKRNTDLDQILDYLIKEKGRKTKLQSPKLKTLKFPNQKKFK